MESFKIENLNFAYPTRKDAALNNINIVIKKGEFVTLCGKSGCGKTTLLRLLKPMIAPFGEKTGEIFFEGRNLSEYSQRDVTEKIGFVMQNPDNQIVTDKVWHELAFGPESLGYSTSEIRARVSEMASFFGIQNWFYKKVNELSGGQKQLLNLAAVMVMQPSVLILDEPTSQLDPIAAQEFLNTLRKINRELGTTVILSEHRLEDAFSVCDRVIVIDKGSVIADDTPYAVGGILDDAKNEMYQAMPTTVKIFRAVENKDNNKNKEKVYINNKKTPLTVKEGKDWLEDYCRQHNIIPKNVVTDNKIYNTIKSKDTKSNKKTVISLKNLWFAYGKDSPDIIKGLSEDVYQGEVFAILGGNGTGKSTALSLISGLNNPYRGEVLINGQKINEVKNLYNGVLGVMPQDPKSLFVKKTVYLDLCEMLDDKEFKSSDKENVNTKKHERVMAVAKLCRTEELLDYHPYDLSGGEQQRAALAKILLKHPKILLLDEPTKGMDADFKREFAQILNNLKNMDITIVMVSHDIEFCAENADRCAMFFDGSITSVGTPKEFFAGKNFYTTIANRMSRSIFKDAVLKEDVIEACGVKLEKTENNFTENDIYLDFYKDFDAEQKNKDKSCDINKYESKNKGIKVNKLNSDTINNTASKPIKFIKHLTGALFMILFIMTSTYLLNDNSKLILGLSNYVSREAIQIINILFLGVGLACIIPQKKYINTQIRTIKSESYEKSAKNGLLSALIILLAVPFTIYIGEYYFGDRKYYFISMLIILEVLVPLFAAFEKKAPGAREVVIISVLCGIAVAGRYAFYMVPQFKPVAAIVIISALCFGGETGFLVGAVSAFVSNFFFGQGPWTPWQMFSFGIIGYVSGILFKWGFVRKTRMSISVLGFILTFVLYGGIMNLSNVILYQDEITKAMIISSYVMGVPFDLIHAVSSFFFLWFISEPMIDKLERVKLKYGLTEL